MSFRTFELLTPEQVAQVVATIQTQTWEDGRTTAGPDAAKVKNNLQLGRSRSGNNPDAASIELIEKCLTTNKPFNRFSFAKAWMALSFNRYETGMFYGNHVDSPLMLGSGRQVRTDLSMTLFLSNPEDYEGGDLVLISEYGEEAIKLPAGHAVVYNANMVHRVEPVTKGCRLACITWIQSYFPDPRIRDILHDLTEVRAHLESENTSPEMKLLMAKSITNLSRLMMNH
jgi:PKHD-type hydroxylase